MVLEITTLCTDNKSSCHQSPNIFVRNSKMPSIRHNSLSVPPIITEARKNLLKSNTNRKHTRSTSNTQFELKTSSTGHEEVCGRSKDWMNNVSNQKNVPSNFFLDENDNFAQNSKEKCNNFEKVSQDKTTQSNLWEEINLNRNNPIHAKSPLLKSFHKHSGTGFGKSQNKRRTEVGIAKISSSYLINRAHCISIFVRRLNYPVSMSLFCLSHSFVYYTSVSTGREARSEVK